MMSALQEVLDFVPCYPICFDVKNELIVADFGSVCYANWPRFDIDDVMLGGTQMFFLIQVLELLCFISNCINYVESRKWLLGLLLSLSERPERRWPGLRPFEWIPNIYVLRRL